MDILRMVHHNPPEPDDDDELLSTCCGANAEGELHDFDSQEQGEGVEYFGIC